MIWQDLMLDRWVATLALRDAAMTAFGVPAAAVVIVDDADELVSTPPTARVILERTRQHRHFPLQILVVVRDDAPASRLAGLDGALDVTRALAARLDATVLFAEGPLSPSGWVQPSEPGTEPPWGVCGTAVDFLAAVIGKNENKARSYLAPTYQRTVADIRKDADITVASTGFSVRRCSLTGSEVYFEAQLNYQNGNQRVIVQLEESERGWEVVGVQPGGG